MITHERYRFAGLMAKLTVALMVFAVTVTSCVWIFFDHMPVDMFARLGPSFQPSDVSALSRFLGFAVMMIPTGIGLYGLSHIRSTFLESELGQPFSPKSVDGFRRFAWSVLAYVISVPMMKAALSVILSWHFPEGQKMLAIEISSNDVIGLFLAGLLVAVGHLFSEAHKLAEENAKFV